MLLTKHLTMPAAAGAMALLLGGCAQGTDVAAAPSAAACATKAPAGVATRDRAPVFDKPPVSSSLTTMDFAAIPFSELAAAHTATATYRVVGLGEVNASAGFARSEAAEQHASREQTRPPAADGKTPFNVSRPVALELERVLGGQAPECLFLDIPGGRTEALASIFNNFPESLNGGDRVLALLAPSQSGRSQLAATSIFKVNADNTVTVPWTPGIIDLNGTSQLLESE